MKLVGLKNLVLWSAKVSTGAATVGKRAKHAKNYISRQSTSAPSARHTLKHCKKKLHTKDKPTCTYYDEYGHYRHICPNLYLPPKYVCPKCGELGHPRKACPRAGEAQKRIHSVVPMRPGSKSVEPMSRAPNS